MERITQRKEEEKRKSRNKEVDKTHERISGTVPPIAIDELGKIHDQIVLFLCDEVDKA